MTAEAPQGLIGEIVAAVAALAFAITGGLMMLDKLKFFKKKDNDKPALMSHDEVLEKMPIFYHLKTDVQSMQARIEKLEGNVACLGREVSELKGEIKHLQSHHR